MPSHVTHTNTEPWTDTPQFPGVSVQLLISKTHTPHASTIRAKVNPGAEITTHTHERETEVVYILDGEAILVLDDEQHTLLAGACVSIAAGTPHSLRNEGDTVVDILAVHSPPTR